MVVHRGWAQAGWCSLASPQPGIPLAGEEWAAAWWTMGGRAGDASVDGVEAPLAVVVVPHFSPRRSLASGRAAGFWMHDCCARCGGLPTCFPFPHITVKITHAIRFGI